MRCVDIRKTIQSFGYLIVTQAFRELQDGEGLEILMDRADCERDLVKILPKEGYEVVGREAKSAEEEGVTFRLRKIRK